jgi:sulfate transport system substrate-binding protein
MKLKNANRQWLYVKLGILTAITTAAILLVGFRVGEKINTSLSEGRRTVTILNVSYDPTRKLFEEYNEVFAQYWKEKTGQDVVIGQSHGGSGKQARAVIDGLDADVVTLGLGHDIDAIHQNGERLHKDWQELLPNRSTPYTSTIVFLVRKGNPMNIQDWDDLIEPGVEIITPNPKISGGARWNYLAAWGYALLEYDNDPQKAREFVEALYRNVPIQDSGARDALTTFLERDLGDVLISWESEAFLAGTIETFKDEFQIVVPSRSILAEPPVAVVDEVVDRKGTRDVAQAYLEYLYSEKGQEIAAQNYYRPTHEEVIQKYAFQFSELELFTIEEMFGGWAKAQSEHFADGGIFDQIDMGRS